MDTKQIQISDYNYPLPDKRIAKFPLPERDSSKLLVYRQGLVSHTGFRSLPSLLPQGALMVFNNTRVIQARLHFRKESKDAVTQGALIEIFLLEPASPVEYQENFSSRAHCQWHCMIGNLKKWKEGALHRTIRIADEEVVLTATRQGQASGTSHMVDFQWEGNATWAELLDAVGELPIPPYLNRKTEASDLITYQTVYSRIKGSVAAPTAGLHFTDCVLTEIDARGIERQEVTLHVGAGTFKPVKSENIGGHDMHTEHISVNRSVLQSLLHHQAEAIAVGTTSVRTLESLYYMGIRAHHLMQTGQDTGCGEELHVQQWEPYGEMADVPSAMDSIGWLLQYMDTHELDVLHSSTQIIIAPGYTYHIVRMMVTNFHQPQSTLLLLVSAFVHGDWRTIYDYALANDFRFLSYGDSSLLIP
ncbi:MAG: S-adenosylmethionine:tRNA ribosyltransferase-isomerase [Bacteroidaceae bacterium]